MRSARIRIAVFASALAVVFATVAATPSPTQFVHASGLLVLGPLDRHLPQLPEPLHTALGAAQNLAEQNPTSLGYPWVNRARGEIVLAPIGAVGTSVAQRWMSTAPEAQRVPVRTQAVTRSYEQLQRIQHEAIDLSHSGVPDAHLINLTGPDDEHDRTFIGVERVSDALLFALAARYGTDAIVIRVEPGAATHNISRDADNDPFWGGAALNVSGPAGNVGCTGGFAFYSGSTSMMLTAGHCAASGGSAYTPYGGCGNFCYYMGDIPNGSWENWDNGVGSVCVTGQSSNCYGDLAMVQVSSSRLGSTGRVYSGASSGDNTYRAVREWWTTPSQVGDQVCTDGSVTTERCGYQVYCARCDSSRGAKQVIFATRSNFPDTCLAQGDSGSPIYTIRSDGAVSAKGIAGGSGGNGVTSQCTVDYTDIGQAWTNWPSVSIYTQ